MNWEILLKYVNKEADADDYGQVENWLAEHKENRYLLDYLQKRAKQLQKPLKQADIHEQWVALLDRIFESKNPVQNPKRFNLYSLTGIAATVLLVSLFGWFYLVPAFTHNKVQVFTLQTPANSRGRVTLPDGTLLYLGPASKISYDNSFGVSKRIVHITGEAFFSVKHKTLKPFIITTDNHLVVTVLGTSFNVLSHNNHTAEVKVATGLVGVVANHRTLYLKAGEKLNYDASTGQISKSLVDYQDATALKNETLFFKDDDAYQIAQKLQRWYNIDINVLPSAAKHPRFSGEMKDTGIHNLITGLCYATGINYRYKNPHTIILF